MIRKIASLIKHKLGRDYVTYEGLVLPAPHTRYGGQHFRDNATFVKSGQSEVERLIQFCGLTNDSRLLEIGCGRGRLPIGIIRTLGGLRCYTGLDVDKRSIAWCRQHIAEGRPNFSFIHLDVKNERYNPGGKDLNESFSFPLDTQSWDIVYLYSVFSHMEENDVRLYLKEFRRVLAPGGRIFLTAFIQEGVPKMTINPSDYGIDWSQGGPLHCVRFEKGFLLVLFQESGFTLERLDYETETDRQTAFYLRAGDRVTKPLPAT